MPPQLASLVPPWLVATADTADLTIEFGALRCQSDTQETHVAPRASTYVSSYRQTPNPEYIQLQQSYTIAQNSLEDAKLNNILNPNLFSATAVGIGTGLVTKFVMDLSKTSPMLSVPVTEAYAAEAFEMTSTAAVNLNVTVRDKRTDFVDGDYVSGYAEDVGRGLRGVSQTDATGLQNAQPALRSESGLTDEAIRVLRGALADKLRTLGERVFVQRAAVAHHRRDNPGAAVANLLFADDFSASSSELDQALVSRIRTTAVDDIKALGPTLDVLQVAVGAPDRTVTVAPSVDTSPDPPPGSRAAMVRTVLPAVVRIDTNVAQGSGFFVSSDGYVLTNAHVVDDASQIEVVTHQGDRLLARIVSLSAEEDVALLAVATPVEAVRPIGGSAMVDIAIDVLAIGSPLGLDGTVTRGIISGIRTANGLTWLQTDAPISPGNSGGPLITEDGYVIGINTWRLPLETGADSVGFALAIDEALRVFASYLR